MEAYRCPAAARNRFEHQRFMQTFRTLSDQVRRDGVDTAHVRALKGELTGWLRSHILETDAQLRPCVQLDPSTLQP
jgi:hemerythrin